MSDYEDCFSFTVENSHRMLELKIVIDGRLPALCAQVHKMSNNAFMMYWNMGLSTFDFFCKVRDYYSSKLGKRIDMLTLEEILAQARQDADFVTYVKQFTPANRKKLNKKDMDIIYALINADWGPSCVANNGGLDGHRYYLKIDGGRPREYETWCTIPSAWSALKPLINLVVDDIVKIEDKYRIFYMPAGTVRYPAESDSIDFEIPPSLKK